MDTTKRQSTSRERFLEAVLHSAIDYAIISMDLNGLVTIWNEGAVRILGWSEEEMLGQPAGVFFTEEDQQNAIPQQEMRDALEHGRGNDERWHLRKDGSKFWASGEMMVLRSDGGSPEGFLKILRDRTEERHRQERQKLLMHELNHRLKNTLSVIQSIVTQSLRGASSVAEVGSTLQDRISAYSRAHDILMHENWSSTDLKTVVESAVSSLGLEGSPRFLSSGPYVELDPQPALAISLVLHELGTNARKYGALSNTEGVITMRWTLTNDAGEPSIEATWAESGGPKVVAPSKKGFGSRLIGVSLASFGELSIDYLETGLVLKLRAPLEKLQRQLHEAE
ncbi:HWE histidine kinase domain-containing protein [Neorhizobium sp. BT27B]|uniref:sensor histidine kinase n=1 Tax=Neorhizobium sp. BT27B TaxID=3142625 RepID=UPI003D288545